jgi:hypothetical protein
VLAGSGVHVQGVASNFRGALAPSGAVVAPSLLGSAHGGAAAGAGSWQVQLVVCTMVGGMKG